MVCLRRKKTTNNNNNKQAVQTKQNESKFCLTTINIVFQDSD